MPRQQRNQQPLLQQVSQGFDLEEFEGPSNDAPRHQHSTSNVEASLADTSIQNAIAGRCLDDQRPHGSQWTYSTNESTCTLDETVSANDASKPAAVALDFSPNARESISSSDDGHPAGPFIQSKLPAKGKRRLLLQDRKNLLLLVLLYFLQGIPLGLAGGSVPLLLKPHLSYSQIGVFSLASYPYSLKLLWSPIIDAVWHPKVGRRKSWLIPTQLLSGMGMIILSYYVEEMLLSAGDAGGSSLWAFAWYWFVLVFMAATQDIAVDGWALTLLSRESLPYASTAHVVGLTAGQFVSFTLFLALNSSEFANTWIRPRPGDNGLISLSGFLNFWGWIFLIFTTCLAIFKPEARNIAGDGPLKVYRSILDILRLRNIQILVAVHLLARLGFEVNDAATNLKLIDLGLHQDDIALLVLIDFPFEIATGYLAGIMSSKYLPMDLWCWAFCGRVAAAITAQITVLAFPHNGVGRTYFLCVIASHVLSTITTVVMFVSFITFHMMIADPANGGMYMTLLATQVSRAILLYEMLIAQTGHRTSAAPFLAILCSN